MSPSGGKRDIVTKDITAALTLTEECISKPRTEDARNALTAGASVGHTGNFSVGSCHTLK